MMARFVIEEIGNSISSTFHGILAELPVTIAITATAMVAKVIVSLIL